MGLSPVLTQVNYEFYAYMVGTDDRLFLPSPLFPSVLCFGPEQPGQGQNKQNRPASQQNESTVSWCRHSCERNKGMRVANSDSSVRLLSVFRFVSDCRRVKTGATSGVLWRRCEFSVCHRCMCQCQAPV